MAKIIYTDKIPEGLTFGMKDGDIIVGTGEKRKNPTAPTVGNNQSNSI